MGRVTTAAGAGLLAVTGDLVVADGRVIATTTDGNVAAFGLA